MEIGIKACEIMNEDFPVFDSSITIKEAVRRLNKKYEACLVIEDGFFHSLLTYRDLLMAFFQNKKSLGEIKPEKTFVVVSPDTDSLEIIERMRDDKIDFVIVKDRNFLGLITKKEIAEISQVIFDKVSRDRIIEAV